MVVYTCDPSTQKEEAVRPHILRPVLSTKRVPGQLRLHTLKTYLNTFSSCLSGCDSSLCLTQKFYDKVV